MTVFVSIGPDQGRSLDLEPGTHLVGKHPDCGLELSDPKVSRQHVELQVTAHGILVRDLGSKNGSFVQGARFTEVTLGAGGSIQLGDTTLVFQPTASPGVSSATWFGRLYGSSVSMRRLFGELELFSPSDATILIAGETGVGKDLCARAIHEHSARKGKAYVVCDIAGITRSLMESELFGHVRGSFSGAVADRAGAFEEADGGTIFIDEIGELEPELQPRLLRAIDQRQVKRVGDTRYRSVDVRVIAATNRDLREEVRLGRFRSDLFHRLAVAEVSVPPLRERREDLPVLVERLLGGSGVSASPAALALLAAYEWPGNVRELRNVLERAVALCGADKRISPQSLGLEAPVGLAEADSAPGQDFFAAREKLLAAWEKSFLVQLLQATSGNVSEAARKAGIDRGHLHRLIKKYDIAPER